MVEVMKLDIHASEQDVLTATLKELQGEEARTAAEKVDRLMQHYRARGLAVVGVQETLEALAKGQVEELLISGELEESHPQPYGDSCWQGKPVAVMGASPGFLGTARAQYHLRQCFVFLDMHALNKPEVMIGGAPQKFDAAGNLTDEQTRKSIQDLLAALAAWTRRLR